MAKENHGVPGKNDPALLEMPQFGWQTVTFWASRFGFERDYFVRKLKSVGVKPNSFDLIRAEDLFRAIERMDDDRD